MLAIGCLVTRLLSTTALRSDCLAVGTGLPFLAASRTAAGSDGWSRLLVTVTSCHVGGVPLRVFNGEAVVIHNVVRSTMKPISPVNAARNPSRAPRFVASSTYTDPQNKPIAAATTRIPRIVGYHVPLGGGGATWARMDATSIAPSTGFARSPRSRRSGSPR